MLPVLAVPVLPSAVAVATIPLRRRRAVWIAAALILWAFVLVTGFSIGFLYLPATVALVVAIAS